MLETGERSVTDLSSHQKVVTVCKAARTYSGPTPHHTALNVALHAFIMKNQQIIITQRRRAAEHLYPAVLYVERSVSP